MVIGDIILDKYLWGDVTRISPEAPVPVFDTQGETSGCGGAANVAQNIASLKGQVELVGVIGKDRAAEKLLQKLNQLNIGVTGICIDSERPTSTKTRVIACVGTSHNDALQKGQHLLRIDNEIKRCLPTTLKETLMSTVLSQLARIDAIVFADYDKGVVSRRLIRALVARATPLGIPIIADPKQNHFWHYDGVTAITPNQKEAAGAVQQEISDELELRTAGEEILGRLGVKAVLITRDEQGMTLFFRNPAQELEIMHLPANSGTVTDVTGAGDTVAAVFALSIAAGNDMRSAARLSSLAGGIVVRKMGCATVTPAELLAEIRDEETSNRLNDENTLF